MKEFIKELLKGTEYDYIANNYYKMSKEELKEIILDYMFLTNINKEELISEIKDRTGIE